MSPADPRETPIDPMDTLLAELDQHLANAENLGRLLAGEWQACVAAGMPGVAAAVLIGTRWGSGS